MLSGYCTGYETSGGGGVCRDRRGARRGGGRRGYSLHLRYDMIAQLLFIRVEVLTDGIVFNYDRTLTVLRRPGFRDVDTVQIWGLNPGGYVRCHAGYGNKTATIFLPQVRRTR